MRREGEERICFHSQQDFHPCRREHPVNPDATVAELRSSDNQLTLRCTVVSTRFFEPENNVYLDKCYTGGQHNLNRQGEFRENCW